MPQSDRTDPGSNRARYPGTFLLAFREAADSLGWHIQSWRGDSVACTDGAGEKLLVGLENLFRRVRRQDRGEWPKLVAEFLRKVNVGGKSDDLDRDLSEVADRLLLRVGPPFPQLPGAAKVWNQPLDATGLVVSLVIDHAETMSYVTEEMIERSGTPGSDWLERAMTNLRERTPREALEQVHKDSSIQLCAVGDAYDSSRALIVEPHFLQAPHGYFLAIPSRDELLVLPMSGEAMATIHLLKLLARQNHQKAPYPVSDEIFWVHHGKWHRFPVEVKGNEVSIQPPAEFLAVFDALKE